GPSTSARGSRSSSASASPGSSPTTRGSSSATDRAGCGGEGEPLVLRVRVPGLGRKRRPAANLVTDAPLHVDHAAKDELLPGGGGLEAEGRAALDRAAAMAEVVPAGVARLAHELPCRPVEPLDPDAIPLLLAVLSRPVRRDRD